MSAGTSRTSYAHPAELHEALRSMQQYQHSLSVYLEQMAQRISDVDPHVHAFLPEAERRQRLRREGDDLRRTHPDPKTRPTLYGATVGVKDIFHADGFVTRAGTDLPPQLFAGSEAACVTKLKAAGALVVGKTITTEFAYFEPGPTRNPHDIDHTPGGSSSGSAAAVAAGLCTLALGTQTIGSVIRPAAYCGVVGFKPSLDRIPTDGIVYFSRTIDHVGLFTQDVAGMSVAAGVLCANWAPARQGNQLPVLGVPDGPYLAQTDANALREFEEQVLMLQVAGYTVRRIRAFDDIDELNDLHRRLVFAEFAQEHALWFEEFEGLYRPRTVEAILAGRSVTPDELDASRAHCLTLRSALIEQMEEKQIDLWICPAAPGEAPLGIASTGDPNMNLPWTHAGMPAITIPAGRGEQGLPLGIQLVARFGADEDLFTWAETMSGLVADPIDEEGM